MIIKFKKNDSLMCIADGCERGFAIYSGEIYQAAEDSFKDDELEDELIELVENGDGEIGTIYLTRDFIKV